MSKTTILKLFIPAAILMVSGCKVDESYDFSQKKPDLNMTFFEDGIALPIGGGSGFVFSDYITVEEDGQIVVDAAGNYSISVSGSPAISSEVSVPDIEVSSFQCNEAVYTQAIPSGLDIALGTDLPFDLTLGTIGVPIVIQSDLPSQIIDVKSIDVEVPVTVSLKINAGAATIKEGFSMSFPSFITLSDPQGGAVLFNDGHAIRTTAPLTATASGASFSFTISHIDIPEGAISSGKVNISDEISISCAASINAKDFSAPLPSSLVISISETIGTIKVENAVMKLSVSSDVDGTTIDLSSLESVSENFDDFDLLLSDPVLRVTVRNDFPFVFNASGLKFTAVKGSSSREVTVPSFNIPAAATTDVFFSRKGGKASAGGMDVVVPNLSDLIRDLPTSVIMSKVSMSIGESGFVEAIVGKKYVVGIPSYGFYAPLSLDKDSRISVAFDVEDIDLSSADVELKNASIGMDIINSIPFSLEYDVQALDADARPSDVGLKFEGNIAAGTVANPSTNPISISFDGDGDALSKVKALRLLLQLTASADNSALNKNQGIDFKNMYISLAGIGVNLNEKED